MDSSVPPGQPASSVPAEAARRARARRGLGIYFTVLVLGSGLLEFLLIRTGEPIGKHTGLIALLMWTPAFASLVARLVLREGIRDVSFRFGGKEGGRALLIAWLYPLSVGFAAYGLAWIAGLAAFAPPETGRLAIAGLTPMARFAALLGLNLTVGAVVSCVFAAGEEIGWRGYMLTRLIDAGLRRPVLASGVIWAAWHLPLILTGQYASSGKPALSAALFLCDVVAIAYLIARLRLESGSVWPAVLLHGSWNTLIQGVFDVSSKGSTLLIGESGVFVVVFNILFVLLLTRGTWRVRRSPRESPEPLRGLAA
jgi:membrane protease YdiL (CAAX protease family)